ncbi:uncharacterized protein LOC143056150 [Mytilus galloprovincialis]|uniref:uncharacterized protein LOC143056150 n=1 Tax=Mytilus galloprovincialis TaxID=29158 RepID=UPI003F7BF17B
MSLPLTILLLGSCVIWSFSEAGYCDFYKACSQVKYTSQKYTESCSFWKWGRCSKYRHRTYTGYYSCIDVRCCNGYTGENCTQAICNGSTTCQNGGTCTTPNYCTCIPGFASPNCEDIDECSLQNGGCDQNCANTHGSFECSCDRGYLLQNDNKTCIDINECLNKNGDCEQICRNTNGSFHCRCRDGFVLLSDGKTCTDKNECIFSNGGCSQICVNDYESHHCECSPGFKLEDDGQSCSDIDECQTSSRCDHECQNNIGSYTCSCRSGFQLGNNGFSCHGQIERQWCGTTANPEG